MGARLDRQAVAASGRVKSDLEHTKIACIFVMIWAWSGLGGWLWEADASEGGDEGLFF